MWLPRGPGYLHWVACPQAQPATPSRNPVRKAPHPVSPSKTQRRKAASRARYEAYLQRRAAKERRRLLIQRALVGVLIVAVIGASSWWFFASRGSDTPDDVTAEPTATELMQWSEPEQVLDEGVAAAARMVTNRGEIVVELDTQDAPFASNSLAFLASEGYYDQTRCHRLTAVPPPNGPLYVLQCGDRTGTGVGPGPGYTVPDENLPEAETKNYPAGTVAMAEPAGGEAGSQFFLVYEDTSLPPTYTIVGQVTEGMDVLRRIAKGGIAGQAEDGAPLKPVFIKTITVEQG